jgi:endoglucanase
MIVGHADKIRMQVRSIGEDGKIYVNSDSFLPVTLLGLEVKLFSEDPNRPGHYRVLENGTIEALGAIHFADEKYRSGDQGIKKEMLYLELGLHGENRKKQVEALGIRPGDSILLDRPVRRGFAPNTIYGAYLDNGLGCFTVCETARRIAQRGGLANVRVLFTVAPYEEIGRLGSRVLANELHPDALIGVDVNHDLKSAPNAGEKRFNPQEMGKGFTLSVGSIASERLNRIFEETARSEGLPFQRDVVGVDTGTDAMAAALGSIDAAAASIGFPIRNMHTISELGHTGDVLAAIHGLDRSLAAMDAMNGGRGLTRADLQQGHPRLDQAEAMPQPDVEAESKS